MLFTIEERRFVYEALQNSDNAMVAPCWEHCSVSIIYNIQSDRRRLGAAETCTNT